MNDFNFKRLDIWLIPSVILLFIIARAMIEGPGDVSKTLSTDPSVVLKAPKSASKSSPIIVELMFRKESAVGRYEITLNEKDLAKDDLIETTLLRVSGERPVAAKFTFTPSNFEMGGTMELYVEIKKDGKPVWNNKQDPLVVKLY